MLQRVVLVSLSNLRQNISQAPTKVTSSIACAGDHVSQMGVCSVGQPRPYPGKNGAFPDLQWSFWAGCTSASSTRQVVAGALGLELLTTEVMLVATGMILLVVGELPNWERQPDDRVLLSTVDSVDLVQVTPCVSSRPFSTSPMSLRARLTCNRCSFHMQAKVVTQECQPPGTDELAASAWTSRTVLRSWC